MRKFSIVIAILAFYAFADHVVFAQDTAGDIASLQAQIERLRSMVNIASEEADKSKTQSLQKLESQMRTWENQLSNIDNQISRLDQQIAAASDQQKGQLIQSLSNMLRQKASADAALVRLRLQIEEEAKKYSEEKSILLGDYNSNIETLNAQLEQLVKIDCCINGTCEKKTAPECVAAGGIRVSDCDLDCVKINCCKEGVSTQTTRSECASQGGKEVAYPSYECETFKCKKSSGECEDLTRAACENNGGTVGTKTECP